MFSDQKDYNLLRCVQEGDRYSWELLYVKSKDCVITQCSLSDLPNHENGSVLPGNTQDVTCTKNYRLVGNETVVCNNNGEWSDLPQCIITQCTREVKMLHGS